MRVADLILVLKALPQDSELIFDHNGETPNFSFAEIKSDTYIIEYDDDGIELKKKKIETSKPTSYLHLDS